MPSIPPIQIAMFIGACALQILMAAMLPAAKGYTNLWPTLGVIVCINLAILILARLTAAGAQLSLLIPLSAVFVPLGAVIVGVLIYKEPASLAKFGLLISAFVLIGLANKVA